MNRTESIEYLTRCADDSGTHWSGGRSCPLEDCPTCKGTNDAGWLATPGSRYGSTSADCAPVAYRWATVLYGVTDHDAGTLDHLMGLVVNDSDEPQGDLQDYAIGLSGASIDDMVTGYLTCQLWAGLDYEHDRCGDDCDRGEPHPWDDNYDVDDVSDEYRDKITDELRALVAEHPLAVRMYVAQRKRDTLESASEYFGHDFYLTREGHGAGFWDRGLGELGDYLTQISKWAGSADDLSDDGTGVLR